MTDNPHTNPFANMSEEQLDEAFTLIVAAAFDSDLHDTEDYLRERGIIGDGLTAARRGRFDYRRKEAPL